MASRVGYVVMNRQQCRTSHHGTVVSSIDSLPYSVAYILGPVKAHIQKRYSIAIVRAPGEGEAYGELTSRIPCPYPTVSSQYVIVGYGVNWLGPII
jgi:hypothetical protein